MLRDVTLENNPVVRWLKEWIHRMPYFTRNVIFLLTGLEIIALAGVDTGSKISNIPILTLYRFQLWRVLLSPLVMNGVLDWLFSCLIVSTFGGRIEREKGSAVFLVMMVVLGSVVNITFLFLMVLLSLNPLSPNPNFLYARCDGFWIVTYGFLVYDCLQMPEQPRRFWILPFSVPSKYYPWALVALFSLLFGVRISSLIAIGVGYIYSYGYLEFTVPSMVTANSWEQGCMRSLIAAPGFIQSAAAAGFEAFLPSQDHDSSARVPLVAQRPSTCLKGGGIFSASSGNATGSEQAFAGTGKTLVSDSSVIPPQVVLKEEHRKRAADAAEARMAAVSVDPSLSCMSSTITKV